MGPRRTAHSRQAGPARPRGSLGAALLRSAPGPRTEGGRALLQVPSWSRSVSVTIVPVGLLQPLVPRGSTVLRDAAGKTVAEVLAELQIDSDLVAMVLVNGRQTPKDTVLSDGDTVKLIPFVGGGRR
ncbi:MAG: MoaD/ThiS family protein [Anaerolineae bacterium]|nr:MoaD/ThiS family protein [Anaerolineae bacterium]